MWWSKSTYGRGVVEKYGLYIVGLPQSDHPFGHPSNTKGGTARLVMLRRMWETGEIAFAKASEEMRSQQNWGQNGVCVRLESRAYEYPKP